MADILVPISPGELLDKITILRIKAARLSDPSKLAHVRHELALLEHTWQRAVADGVDEPAALEREAEALERVNAELWDIEDRIRDCEAERRFDPQFIELARAVYLRNDERAAIKRRINVALRSALIEEKSYRPYR